MTVEIQDLRRKHGLCGSFFQVKSGHSPGPLLIDWATWTGSGEGKINDKARDA